MKKLVLVVMVCLLVVSCVWGSGEKCMAAVRPEPDGLQYTLTKSAWANLNISTSGEAICTGYIKADSMDSSVDLTVKLMQKSGTSWQPYATWSVRGAKGAVELEKTCTVEAGTYKVVITGAVRSSTGTSEPISKTSSQKTYA